MPKTVLIVDDHSDTRIICRELLSFYGYRAIEATNGREALAMAEQYRPDMILLDFLMPERDGLQVLGDLRESAGLDRTPVVLYTAVASRIEEFSAHPQITQVLLKPVESSRLLEMVRSLIGSAEEVAAGPEL